MLCQELNNEQSQARIAAGLALKNAMTARVSQLQEHACRDLLKEITSIWPLLTRSLFLRRVHE